MTDINLLPKISVIVPNYNHGNYLEQRIDSVLGQTYQNLEVILLDDCSTDNSREVIEHYRNNPRIREIIFNEKNSGSPFKQWRMGLERASGQWTWIAESDDYADPFFVEKLITHALSVPNVGLVYCDSKIVTNGVVSKESFASIKNAKFNSTRWSINHTNNGLAEIEDYLLSEGTINNTSAVIFNTTILRNANVFDVEFRYIGDKYTFLKVLAKGNIAYVAEALNYYRDPFNAKHSELYLNYFREHFLIFHWVSRNLKQIDNKKFISIFYQNTTFSVFTQWSRKKFLILRELWQLNPELFLKCLWFNTKRPFFKR